MIETDLDCDLLRASSNSRSLGWAPNFSIVRRSYYFAPEWLIQMLNNQIIKNRTDSAAWLPSNKFAIPVQKIQRNFNDLQSSKFGGKRFKNFMIEIVVNVIHFMKKNFLKNRWKFLEISPARPSNDTIMIAGIIARPLVATLLIQGFNCQNLRHLTLMIMTSWQHSWHHDEISYVVVVCHNNSPAIVDNLLRRFARLKSRQLTSSNPRTKEKVRIEQLQLFPPKFSLNFFSDFFCIFIIKWSSIKVHFLAVNSRIMKHENNKIEVLSKLWNLKIWTCKKISLGSPANRKPQISR